MAVLKKQTVTGVLGMLCLALPAVLPVLYLIRQYNIFEPPRSIGSETILALPIFRERPTDWISAWAELDDEPQEEINAAEFADPPEVPAGPVSLIAGQNTFPVSIFGYILEDDERLYCLYDERGDRWFRLAAGRVDEAAQVKVEWEETTGVVNIYSLETGNRYRINPGTKELERVEDN